MAVNKNPSGISNARRLINSGDYDTSSDWSFSAADGNKLLGDDDWMKYKKWFLAIDTEETEETKARYKYPFGKNGKVYRSALIAIRQRSGQQDETDIFDAAGELVDLIDSKKSIANDILEELKKVNG